MLFDEIVVSIDGSKSNHDLQRGEGAYDTTVENLRILNNQRLQFEETSFKCEQTPAQITIAATLQIEQMEGSEIEDVRELGEAFKLPVKFKPILPLGRGRKLNLKTESFCINPYNMQVLELTKKPTAFCGLGKNLYVGADGACYPCYALINSRHFLGNAIYDGLKSVLMKNDGYRKVTVDSNQLCSTCSIRYLCGGICRAWGESGNLDAAPSSCADMYEKAGSRLRNALEVLGISAEAWCAAGLPLTKFPESEYKIWEENIYEGVLSEL